jgi:hypothetical protein
MNCGLCRIGEAADGELLFEGIARKFASSSSGGNLAWIQAHAHSAILHESCQILLSMQSLDTKAIPYADTAHQCTVSHVYVLP